MEFSLFWIHGKCELIEGDTIEDAFRKAGYGGRALSALDFYAYGNELDSYKYNKKENNWEKLKCEE